MNFHYNETPKVGQEKISQREIHHEDTPDKKEDIKIPEREVSLSDRAESEIEEAGNLVHLEDQARQFSGTIEKLGIPWSVDTAGQYENDYALPATLQAEALQGLIIRNNSVRHEAAQEGKEKKTFNEVSRIMENKKVLCIHIMTGLSNDLNDTTRKDAITPGKLAAASFDDAKEALIRKKIEQEALLQLKTLVGLNPSVSASLFSDTHKFEGSWFRDVSQPIGAILREGTCDGISSGDASTKSRSVKKRYGTEPVTEEGLEKVLSENNSSFTQSGYNEAAISEPRIGALFMPTNGNVSREILQALRAESSSYGYLILFESKGDFFELSPGDMEVLLQGADERISVADYLRDEKRVPRDEIRKRLESLDSQELGEKEKKRFDTYLEHYDLKPHFSWSGELATTIETERAFHLAREVQKLEGYEKNLKVESETEGALTKRLFEYFTQHPGTQKSYEERKRIYVNGVLYEKGEDNFLEEQAAGLFSDAEVETRITKEWQYEEETEEPPMLIEGVQGIGEISNIQKKQSLRLFVQQSHDGVVFYRASENMHLLVNTMNAKTGEVISSDSAVHYLASETMEKTAEGAKREESSFKKDVQPNFRPEVVRYRGGDSFTDTPDDMRQKIAGNVFKESELKQVALYAKTLAEMYQRSGDEAMRNEWQAIAESISPDANERYMFIRSKLNRDGTLKLDKDDVSEL